jgi:hypothetical protein
MFRWIAPLAAMAVIVAAGIVDGRWTGRWRDTAAETNAPARLATVATRLGDWESQDFPVDERQIARGGYSGFLARTYQHRYQRGQKLVVLIVCGRPGPVSVHTPEVCYGGLGYKMTTVESREQIEVDRSGGPQKHEFFTATFAKPGSALPDQFRLYWAYSADGQWQAPGYPRAAFATEGLLFKLYVLHRTGTETAQDAGTCEAFIRALTLELEQKVFSGS